MSDIYTNAAEIWKKYEIGKEIIDRNRLVPNADDAYENYIGNQWRGLEDGGEKQPVLNIIKPSVDYKAAILTQNEFQIDYSSEVYDPEMAEVEELLNIKAAEQWENLYMDSELVTLVTNSILSGGMYFYFTYEPGKKENGIESPGKIALEFVEQSSVIFGDQKENDIQKQPFIIIPMRRRVEDVRKEAIAKGMTPEQAEEIVADDDSNNQQGSQNRDDKGSVDKCTCLIKIQRKGKYISIIGTTKTIVYSPLEETELSDVTLAGFVWDKIKGTQYGKSMVTDIIPNQIWINKLMAFRLISAKMTAFPKLAYDADIIENGDEITNIGTAMKVRGGGLQDVKNSIGYLNPASMSGDAKTVFEELITKTKENLGASDVALGGIDPTQASGRAILAVKEMNETPSSGAMYRFKKMIEQIARIWFDMWVYYSPYGLQITKDVDGQKVVKTIPKEVLRSFKPKIKVTIQPRNELTKLAEQQKVDNLLERNLITLDEYAEILPDNEQMKPKLELIISKRAEIQQLQNTLQQTQQQSQQLMTENQQMKQMLGGMQNG